MAEPCPPNNEELVNTLDTNSSDNKQDCTSPSPTESSKLLVIPLSHVLNMFGVLF